MALLHNLTVPSSIFFFLFFLLSGGLSPPQIHVRAQQPYGKEIDDCTNNHNSSGMLGYFCGSSPSCQAFLTFTAMAPYSTLSSIAALLGTSPTTLAAANAVASAATPLPEKTTVLVPATCGCTSTPEGNFYQHNATASYAIKLGDTLQLIAKGTFQGLTTCQAIEAQALRGAPPETLAAGELLSVVPLRCACPTAAQAAGGARFLVSYVVAELDDVSHVAARFGVHVADVAAANELLPPYTIFPSTTLLIPVTSQPNVSSIQSPPPPPPPPPSPVVAPSPGKKTSNRVGIYIGVAVAVVAVVAIASAAAFLAMKSRRRRKLAGDVLAAGELPKKFSPAANTNTDTTSSAFTGGGEFSLSTSEAFTSISVADIKSSLRVYSYGELMAATDGFSHDRHIGGSVYRAEFGGDVAAIEVVDDRNVSTEVEIMRNINHLNLIRLIGLCHHHGRWYLVTEFADHGALRDRLFLSGDGAAPVMTWTERMQVALDVAEGLRYLHEYTNPKCVHMDVSSRSILLAGDVDGRPRAKLRSFGAARAITGGEEEEEAMFTMTSRIEGTRGYMAPEYLEHGVVSPKADVYSLGVVLMELLTGKDAEEVVGDPFAAVREVVEELDGGGGDEVVVQRMEELVDPAMPPGSCPMDGVVMMVRLIERCVRRDAAGRPTVGEVARRLLKMKGVEAVVSWRSSPESPRSPGK